MLEYERLNKIPRQYLDINPFATRTGIPGDEPAQPQLEELDSQPQEGVSEEPPPVDDTSEQATDPKYDVTIKGAERLDDPTLPEE